MRRLVYVGLAVLVASAAFGVSKDAAGILGSAPGPNTGNDALGSIIQSWTTPAASNARACCETAGYVIVNTYYNPQYVCTPAGSLVRTHSISLGTGWRDSSRCHLGSGYYAIIQANSPYTVAMMNHSTGSVAASFNTQAMSPYPMNLAYDPDANCYYANSYYMTTSAYKYSTTGSMSGTITIGGMGSYVGALGYTKVAKGANGAYIWASNFGATTDAICTTTGSVVATWSAAESNGCGGDCGKSSASNAWVVWEIRNASLRVYEYDIEGTSAVAPESLGKIKTLFN
jgi:hypothetical protein